MSISKKKPEVLSSVDATSVNKVLLRVYDDLNEVINAVNQQLTVENTNRFEGNLGDIRVVQVSDKTYEIQGRTKDGWASNSLTFKDE